MVEWRRIVHKTNSYPPPNPVQKKRNIIIHLDYRKDSILIKEKFSNVFTVWGLKELSNVQSNTIVIESIHEVETLEEGLEAFRKKKENVVNTSSKTLSLITHKRRWGNLRMPMRSNIEIFTSRLNFVHTNTSVSSLHTVAKRMQH